jgi:hypothetical protein
MDQSLFAAPHGLSQRITSFIACACQGIHQLPLFHLIVLIANVHLSQTAKRFRDRSLFVLTRWVAFSKEKAVRSRRAAKRLATTSGLAEPFGSVQSHQRQRNWNNKESLAHSNSYELMSSYNMDQRIHVRPASRDMRNDARSGNINHVIHQKNQRTEVQKLKQQTTLDRQSS